MEDYVEKTSIKQVGTKWGVIAGIIGIVFSLILILGDLILTTGVSFIGWIPFAIVIVLAHKEFKESGDTFMSYGEGLKTGLLLSLIGGLILAVFSFIYSQFIDPEMLDRLKDGIFEQWEESGMNDDQIEQAWKFTSYMFNPYIGFIAGILKTVIVGLILSLIISAITKNSNPELEM